MEKQQLAVALHKIIIKKKLKTKVILISKNNTWDADVADMQLMYKHNKELLFFLCVIDIVSKYSWVVSLKDK